VDDLERVERLVDLVLCADFDDEGFAVWAEFLDEEDFA
jgi:hypothetical protein